MPAGEEKNCERGGYSVCNDIPGFRELCRSVEDLSRKVQRSKTPLTWFFSNTILKRRIDWWETNQRNSAEGVQRNHGGSVNSGSSAITGSERQNQTLTPPLEGEEIQAGYGDIYGVTGNGGEAAL